MGSQGKRQPGQKNANFDAIWMITTMSVDLYNRVQGGKNLDILYMQPVYVCMLTY